EELGGAMALGDSEVSFAGNAAANLGLAMDWLWTYWTPALVVLAVLGLAMALGGRDRARPAVFLALAVLGPVLAFVAASGIWYPRYLLFPTVPPLALSPWGFVAALDAIRLRAGLGARAFSVLVAAGLVVALTPALRFDLALWTDPGRAPLPAIERFQYVTGWPSGYGMRDSM